MKYKLINSVTKKETICDKVTIDGFEYYVSDGEIKLNDPITDKYRVWFWRDDCSLLGRKKIIATNNSHIDIPKAVTDCMLIEKLANTLTSHLTFPEERREGIIFGYNKSQETHPFSEEDMIEFLDFYKMTARLDFNSTGENHGKTTQELLQLWKEQQPKIVYYE